MAEIGPSKTLEQYVNHAGRAGRDGQPSVCTLMCRPSDFNEHDAYTKMDECKGYIDKPAAERIRASLAAQRRFSQNVTECRWRLLMEHYNEAHDQAIKDSPIRDPSWRCLTCDNCARPPHHSKPPTELLRVVICA